MSINRSLCRLSRRPRPPAQAGSIVQIALQVVAAEKIYGAYKRNGDDKARTHARQGRDPCTAVEGLTGGETKLFPLEDRQLLKPAMLLYYLLA